MQIREIHIDGFGNFADQKISGFDSGLNIIYGENESGKTTILEFIRGVLFGFNVKKIGGFKNHYPPLRGGTYGGKLVCLTSSGSRIVITRTGKPGGRNGQVSVLADSEKLSGQNCLDDFLGHASEVIFKNIYAFTLDELQDFGLLKDDEIKNKIYGAGLGLGQVSLAEVKKYFDKHCDDLFKPRGSNPAMNILWADIKKLEREIRDVQSHSAQYGTLTADSARFHAVKNGLESKIEKMESLTRSLQTRLDMYPVYVELADGEAELASLEAVESFPEAGKDNFNLVKSETKARKDRIEEESNALEKLQAQRVSLKINEPLLRMEADVTALVQMVEIVRAAIKDRVGVSQERDSLDGSIQTEIGRIGGGWDEESVLKFEMTEAENSQADSFGVKLDDARQNKKSAGDKLDLHREQKAEERSGGWEIPAWCRYMAFALMGVGIFGIVRGVVEANIPLLAFSAAVIVLAGLFLWLVLKNKNGFKKKDRLESMLAEKLEQAVRAEKRILDEWRSWLDERGLDSLLTPSALEKVVSLIGKVKAMLADRTKLDQRFSRMMETEETAKELAGKVAVCLPNVALRENVIAAIELFDHYLKDAKQRCAKRETLEIQIDEQNSRLTSLNNQLKGLQVSLADLIRSVGAHDEEDFLRKHEIFAKRKSLESFIGDKRKLIQARVGINEAYQRFIDNLRSSSPEDLENESSRVSSQLKELEPERDKVNQSIGETRNRIDQLTSNDELVTLQSALEMKKQELSDLSREWAVSRVALRLLDMGKLEYEKNRQPGVIKTASDFFSRITGYRKIMKLLDCDDILICDDDENRKGVAEMSRGTREQLYLAMRFGLIQEYETRSEPLPVIMDDVFVNFDDDRRDKVIEILRSFSESRQVIILSCHQQSLHLFVSHGARQILIK